MSLNIRQTCLLIHRYTGLVMVFFLIIAGITGALLAFYDELDDVFNHRLAYIDVQQSSQLPIATLHDSVVDTYPKYKFSSLPTSVEPNKSAVFSVDRVRDKQASAQTKAPFQQVYVNTYTGDIIGTRDREQWAWHNTMYKVFWLHRELLLGDIGKLILGIVALVWTLNCFIGFYLTMPRKVKNKNNKFEQRPTKKRSSLLKRWLPAWKIRTKTNTFKLNYDLHHAFGLWLWVILFVIAWSSVGFNLKQVYQPVMQTVVGLESKEDKSSKPKAQPDNKANQKNEINNTLTAITAIDTQFNKEVAFDSAHNKINKANSIAYLSEQATIAAQKEGIEVERLLGLRWIAEDNQWQIRFITNKDIGKKGGASSITVNAENGDVERVNFGYQSASFGSKTDQWLSTLHMGHLSQGQDEHLSHLLYQLFLVLIGLAVTVLSGTGAYLWIKGRQQRIKTAQKLKQKSVEIKPYPQSLGDLDGSVQ